MAAEGTRPDKRNAVALPLRLIIGEEKRLVLLDRPAQRAAELIQIELLGVGGEETARIQIRITEEFETANRVTRWTPT